MSFICHIHNYTEYNQQWNVFSAFNHSKCTHTHTHTWSSEQPTLRRPGSSWGFGALLKGLTSVVDDSCQSRDSNSQPRVTSQMLYPLEPRLPRHIRCVPWELNPQPFALLTQCSTTEPQEHIFWRMLVTNLFWWPLTSICIDRKHWYVCQNIFYFQKGKKVIRFLKLNYPFNASVL